jgi:ribonucleotide reductase alpha subunit
MADLEQLDLLSNEAIDAAGKFATPTWYEAAFKAIIDLCKLGQPFSTDAVWLRLEGLETPEPRAMGSVIRQAAKEGWIVSTGEYQRSTQASNHRRPVLLWRPV